MKKVRWLHRHTVFMDSRTVEQPREDQSPAGPGERNGEELQGQFTPSHLHPQKDSNPTFIHIPEDADGGHVLKPERSPGEAGWGVRVPRKVSSKVGF